MNDPAHAPDTIHTLIRGAAEGRPEDRSRFCARYLPLVRACFVQRWQTTALHGSVDDAVQDAFLECLRSGGALESFDGERGGGFRAFLYGVIRNVARRFEQRRGQRVERERALERGHLDRHPAAADPLSRFFEREWAREVMQQAEEVLRGRAVLAGDAALRRHELLRLRFEEDLPIREIAARWNEDPDAVHRAYRKAREEFRTALEEVVGFHSAGTAAEVRGECERLLGMLG